MSKVVLASARAELCIQLLGNFNVSLGDRVMDDSAVGEPQ
jgi:hypothetical protein